MELVFELAFLPFELQTRPKSKNYWVIFGWQLLRKDDGRIRLISP
jgi:hypothetical protein